MKTHAIRMYETGGPEVLKWEEVDLPSPSPGEIQVQHQAIGLNFIEVYHRSGLYPLPLPTGLGQEGAGVITSVGEDVRHYRPGDRIAYGNGPPGSYAQARNISADKVVPLPDSISFEIAAAIMLKGLTAWYLLHRTYAVKPGQTILFHAAAGGVGLIACQWAKALGARVIGTVGSDAKAEIALAHGCDAVINTRKENIAARVREITNGAGVPVVYDSIGKDTYLASLDCLSPLGLMVAFGNASGPIPPLDPLELARRGSLFFTRASLMHYIAKSEDLKIGAQTLFTALSSGQIKVDIYQSYTLDNVSAAHQALEDRKTMGSTILLP